MSAPYEFEFVDYFADRHEGDPILGATVHDFGTSRLLVIASGTNGPTTHYQLPHDLNAAEDWFLRLASACRSLREQQHPTRNLERKAAA